MADQQHDDEWWIEHANLDDRTKALMRQRRRSHGSPGSRLFFAIFLIAVGVLLFLDNIGLIPVRNIWDYWPLILVGAGLGRLVNCRHPQGRLIGFFLVLFGALLLLVTLHIVQ